MIPEEDHMVALAAGVAAALFEKSWDETEPQIAYVVRIPVAEARGLGLDEPDGGYGVVPFPLQPLDIVAPDGSFTEGLSVLAKGMVDPKGPEILRYLGSPPREVAETIAGLIIWTEAWQGQTPPPEGKGIADMPDAVEVRIVYLLDNAGRLTVINQERGSDAKTFVDKPGEVNTQLRGPMLNALLGILLAVTRQMPRAHVDRTALGRLYQSGVGGDGWIQPEMPLT